MLPPLEVPLEVQLEEAPLVEVLPVADQLDARLEAPLRLAIYLKRDPRRPVPPIEQAVQARQGARARQGAPALLYQDVEPYNYFLAIPCSANQFHSICMRLRLIQSLLL